MPRVGRGRIALSITLVSLATMLAACGASSSAAGSKPVKIDAFIPLTGPSGAIGLTNLPGYDAAQWAINHNGGIMGRKLDLMKTDLGADPADTVAAARKMLAQNPDLSGLVGLTSDTAIVSAQIFDQAKVVTLTAAGTPQLDHVHYPYVFRDFPSDSSMSVAMTAAALSGGYKRAAILFGENAGTQVNAGPLAASYSAHGGTIVINEKLPLDQTSYGSEIAKALAGKPQVIFYETDAQTAATLFPELKDLEQGHTIPILATTIASIPSWLTTVSSAVGGFDKLSQELTFIAPATSPPNSAGPGFRAAIRHVEKKYNISLANYPYVSNVYDSVLLEALAMDLAHSTNPQVYVHDVEKVINDHSGERVTTYAAGVAAIRQHRPFYYATTAGSMYFNQYHSITGSWYLAKAGSNGALVTVRRLPQSLIAKYS